MSHEPEAQDRSIEACDPEGGAEEQGGGFERDGLPKYDWNILCTQMFVYLYTLRYHYLPCLFFIFS